MSKQSMLVPVIGQFAVAPILRVQPTVQRSVGTAAVGAKLRQRFTITNTGTEPIANYDYLITIGETATAFVAAGKALASGDDVRFVLNGLEVARTLKGWNGASSGAWVRIPYLAAGGTITFDMLYSNPQAGTPPTLTAGDTAPTFDPATSTNAQWKYLTDRTVLNAGKGAWYLSTGLAQPEVKLGTPGAWQPVTTLGGDDDRRQQMYSSYVVTATTYYQARFAAKRQRSGTMTANEKNNADGVMIRVPVGITSITCDFLWTNRAKGDTDTTPVGQLVILTRQTDNAPWSILYSNVTLADTETLIAAATYTPAAAVKQLAFAVWPYSGGRIARNARQDRYVEANWNAQLDLNIDSSKLVQSTAQGETTVYELATELRYGGGGAAVGVAPYHSLYLGNAKSATGVGTPRLTAQLNNQVQLDAKTRRPELWDSGLATKVEDIPLDTVSAVDAVLDGVSGALVEREAAEWMPWVPVVNPLPNASFANGLTGWAVGSTHASATVTRSADGTVFSDTASSLKVAVTASTVPTLTLVTDDLNSTFMPIGKRESIVVSHDVRVSTLNLVPRVKLMFYTEAQNPISSATEAQADGALAAINTWERHTFAVRVPDGAVYWRFAFDVYSAALNATGNVWLDNVRVNDVDIVVKGVSPGTLVVSASWYGRFAYA
jgi:hypothetical protein